MPWTDLREFGEFYLSCVAPCFPVVGRHAEEAPDQAGFPHRSSTCWPVGRVLRQQLQAGWDEKRIRPPGSFMSDAFQAAGRATCSTPGKDPTKAPADWPGFRVQGSSGLTRSPGAR